MNPKERIQFDMRQANRAELMALAKLLINLSAVVSTHGLKLTVKKTTAPAPKHATASF